VLPTARWRALDTTSHVAEPRLLFFALKKSLTEHKQRVQPTARGKVAAAGLKKHLPVLPTARWRALDTTSHVAEPRLLFFALKKSLTEHKQRVQPMARGKSPLPLLRA
jgi:hypothetical protein